MKKVFVFLADGFEEVEAITAVDYLRRVKQDVKIIGITGKTLKSARNLTILCDYEIDEVKSETPDMLIFPGGLANAESTSKCELAKKMSLRVHKSGILAGICAAPAIVFHKWGLLEGKKYTCFPGMDENISVKAEKARVVVDGNLITSCSPGSVEEFTFKLVEVLAGHDALNKLKKEIVSR